MYELGVVYRNITRTPGHVADVGVWRWAEDDSLLAQRLGRAQNLHEKLFAWLMLGDERLLVQTHVAGVPQLLERESGNQS